MLNRLQESAGNKFGDQAIGGRKIDAGGSGCGLTTSSGSPRADRVEPGQSLSEFTAIAVLTPVAQPAAPQNAGIISSQQSIVSSGAD